MAVPGHPRAEILVPHSAPIASPTCVLGLHNMTSPALSPPSIPATRPAIIASPTSNTITQVSHSNGTTSVVSDLSDDSFPMTITAEHPPGPPSPSNPVASPQNIIPSPSLSPTSPSLPPSPIQVARKCLSFISYSDLLSSTPTSTQSLSSLTTCASHTKPPPTLFPRR